jgi:hypothetical protein
MHNGNSTFSGGLHHLGNSSQFEQGQSERASEAEPNLLMQSALSGFNVYQNNAMSSSGALQLQDPLSGSSFAYPFAQQGPPAISLAAGQNTSTSEMTHYQHGRQPSCLPSMALNQPCLGASQTVAMGAGQILFQGRNVIVSKSSNQTNSTPVPSSHGVQPYSLCQGAPQQNLQQQQSAGQQQGSLTQHPHNIANSNHAAGYVPQAQNPYAPKTSYAGYINNAGGPHLYYGHHQQVLGQSATATTVSQTMVSPASGRNPQAHTSSGMIPNGYQYLPASANFAGASMGHYNVSTMPSSSFAVGSAMSPNPGMGWSASAGSWNMAIPQSGLLTADESFLTPEWIQSLSNPNLLNPKKRKRRKKPKDQPKRALSAYNIFFKDEREIIMRDGVGDEELAEVKNIAKSGKKEPDPGDAKKSSRTEAEQKICEKPAKKTPTLTQKQKRDKGEKKQRIGFENLGKIIGKRWKELSGPRRAYYQTLADADLIRYKEAMEDWHIKHEDKDFETDGAHA